MIRCALAVLVFLLPMTISVEARLPKRQPRVDATAPTIQPEEHYRYGMEAFDRAQWVIAIEHLQIVVDKAPNASYASEARYHLALAYFYTGSLELANATFNDYLKREGHPARFEQIFRFKMEIADRYHSGARKYLFGSKSMPRWLPAEDDAIEIYEEIHTALPSHEIAALALFRKAEVLAKIHRWDDAVESYQALATRFPKHELAPESYLAVTRLYLERCRSQPHDPNLLALSQLNVRRFRQAFPMEERLMDAEAMLTETRETLAGALLETGRFYEKTEKPNAAMVCYRSALRDFHGTTAAKTCGDRLIALGGDLPADLYPLTQPAEQVALQSDGPSNP